MAHDLVINHSDIFMKKKVMGVAVNSLVLELQGHSNKMHIFEDVLICSVYFVLCLSTF